MAFEFLLLPPEIRVEIYRYVFVTKRHGIRAIRSQRLDLERYSQYRLIELWERKRTSPSGSTSRNGKAEAMYDDPAVGVEKTPCFRAFPFEVTLLRTCRLIYVEAVPILYGENVFNYSCDDISTLETPSPISDDDEYPKVGFLD